jgi:ADP-ribose pyrophosphatase
MLTKLFYTKFLNLFQIKYLHKGKEKSWFFASRHPEGKKDFNKPDAVCIVPLLKVAFNAFKIVMVKQYRPALNGYEYSFPAGLVDNEDILTSAARELREETNLKVTRIMMQSPTVFSSSGMTDESTVIFYVEAEGEPSNKNQEPDEDIEVLVLNVKEALEVMQGSKGFISSKAYLILNHLLSSEVYWSKIV